MPSNKGMKLTKPEHIGPSQLIPGVRQTPRGPAQRAGSGARAWPSVAGLSLVPPAAHRDSASPRRHGARKSKTIPPWGWPRGPFGELGRVGPAFLTASSARRNASGEAERAHVGLSPQRNFGHTSVVARSVAQLKTCHRYTLSNKGMKLTSAERIERSQLIPGVRQTSRESAQRVGYGARAHASVALLSLLPPAARGYRVSTGAARCAQEDAPWGLAPRRFRGLARLGSALLTASIGAARRQWRGRADPRWAFPATERRADFGRGEVGSATQGKSSQHAVEQGDEADER
jgi:hypothetical protein